MFNVLHSCNKTCSRVWAQQLPDFKRVVASLAVIITFAESCRWEGGKEGYIEGEKRCRGNWGRSGGRGGDLIRTDTPVHTHTQAFTPAIIHHCITRHSWTCHNDPEPSVMVEARGESWGSNTHIHSHMYRSLWCKAASQVHLPLHSL